MHTDARHAGMRLAFGPALLFILGMAMNWPLAFVASVFAVLLLQAPSAPSLRAACTLSATAAALMLAAWVVSSILLPYPLLFLLAVGGMVLTGFGLSVAGKSPLLVVFTLLAALLMPLLVKSSLSLALTVALWLPVNLGLALAATWVAFAAFPTGSAAPATGAAGGAGEAGFDPGRRLLRMALVTLPFALLFFVVEGGAVLTLLFVAILTQQLAASTQAGTKVAMAMLTSNLVGGSVAILAYELVVMAPFFPFMALVTVLACLGIAVWFTSGRGDAKLAGSAMTTMLILFGGSMAPFGDNAEVAMVDRLFQVAAALAWVLAAFLALDTLLPERAHGTPNWRSSRRPGHGRAAKAPAPRG
ncbi:DUF2955 domain-containing protein [Tropicimonas marinistellae]|uniref:DUF2955 domain-containing protein n=1 Tax=Tropicimonas marinistellae TaxID=1739787 RepID=UPI00082EDD0B|nr:DUF2955 domain-containing protein [Tropicimonas marinistellae]